MVRFGVVLARLVQSTCPGPSSPGPFLNPNRATTRIAVISQNKNFGPKHLWNAFNTWCWTVWLLPSPNSIEDNRNRECSLIYSWLNISVCDSRARERERVCLNSFGKIKFLGSALTLQTLNWIDGCSKLQTRHTSVNSRINRIPAPLHHAALHSASRKTVAGLREEEQRQQQLREDLGWEGSEESGEETEEIGCPAGLGESYFYAEHTHQMCHYSKVSVRGQVEQNGISSSSPHDPMVHILFG